MILRNIPFNKAMKLLHRSRYPRSLNMASYMLRKFMSNSAFKSAVSDVLLLSSPILICLIVFAFFGDNWDNFMEIPEWSFLSTFLFIEVLKESMSKKRISIDEIMDGKSAICAYGTLILVSSTVMVLSFANSRGYLTGRTNFTELSAVQPFLLLTAVVLSLKVKYTIRKIESKL